MSRFGTHFVLDYGNGNKVQYTYDSYGRVTLQTYEDGDTITYDAIGNPLSDGTWTYTWEHGRQLASMTNGSTTWTYTYDANGMRTSRGNGTTTYSYVYNGSQLSQMTVGNHMLNFTYDASGTPMTVNYNGTEYYYVTNLQGDVVALLDSTGTAVVQYTYDAWGNILTITGTKVSTLGTYNPLRYRGYVYDRETGLYYLQSRYYDPIIGRFLNADIVFDYDAGLQGYNLFTYCGNNPVNRIDISGADSIDLIDGDKEEEPELKGGSGGNGRPSGGGGSTSGDSDAGTPIFRYNGTNPSNLTPKEKDAQSGLSFSTCPKKGSATTTIEAVNGTGLLRAVQDGPYHVSVTPINGSIDDWIGQGVNSIWTKTLKEIVRKY